MFTLIAEKRQKVLDELGQGLSRECNACRTPIVPVKGFERLCPICFKLDRGYELYVGDKALLQLQEQHRTLQAEYDALGDRYRRVRSKAKALMKNSSLLPQRVEQLIRLCHPDKHGGSSLSTEVTQWLLSVRKK